MVPCQNWLPEVSALFLGSLFPLVLLLRLSCLPQAPTTASHPPILQEPFPGDTYDGEISLIRPVRVVGVRCHDLVTARLSHAGESGGIC